MEKSTFNVTTMYDWKCANIFMLKLCLKPIGLSIQDKKNFCTQNCLDIYNLYEKLIKHERYRT